VLTVFQILASSVHSVTHFIQLGRPNF